MQEKIKWYIEVLELEPNSKLFLPLARLLSNAGQINEAINVLQRGLAKHPEYVEARIYYIELLYTDNRTIQCQDQIENMTKLFVKYPSFWEAWGEYVMSKGQSKELALALTFLAACFRDSSMSFSSIFEIGLSELMLKKNVFVTSKKNVNKPLNESVDIFASQECSNFSDVVSRLKDSSDLLEKSSEKSNDSILDRVETAQELLKNRKKEDFSNLKIELNQNDDEEDEVDSQFFSLRTRSMADVLSDQGELEKALDIYVELLDKAVSEYECAELHARIDELTEQLKSLVNVDSIDIADVDIADVDTEDSDDGAYIYDAVKNLEQPDANADISDKVENSEQPDASENVEDEPEQSEGKGNLVSLLESLAVRFEKRSI